MEMNSVGAVIATTNNSSVMDRDLTLSHDEICRLTGYTQLGRQLAELHRRGFWRARRGRVGIILEREHYRAVCASPAQSARPTVRIPVVKGR